MRKLRMHIHIILLLFLYNVNTYAKNFKRSHFVTSIEVIEIRKNLVTIQWKSDQPQAKFHIYYNKKKVISDKFVLKNSKIAASIILKGESTGAYYLYKHQIKLKNPGGYYFAVLIEDNLMIEGVAKGLIDTVISDDFYTLIPEINTTVQPSYLFTEPKKYVYPSISPVTTPYTECLITFLNIEQTEDVFKLRWFVYPKDKSEYVFKIYRSRDPLTQYKSPEGLPEYARVTNQFFFDDRNISFEIPYYYAVVAENSNQWDRGINVFTQAAVLLKKSPAFYIKPIAEYVKKKQQLPIKKLPILSEEEIQQAIKFTLSNLYLIQDDKREKNQQGCSNIPIEEQISQNLSQEYFDNSENNALYCEKSFVKLSKLSPDDNHEKLTKNFLQEIENIRNKNLANINNFVQNLTSKNLNDYNSFVERSSCISEKLEKSRSLENKLFLADQIPKNQVRILMESYLNNSKSIDAFQEKIKKDLKIFELRRLRREDELKQYLSKIYEQDYLQMKESYIKLLRDRKANKMAQIILLNTKKIDFKNVVISPKLGTVDAYNKTIEKDTAILQRDIEKIEDRINSNLSCMNNENEVQNHGYTYQYIDHSSRLPILKTEEDVLQMLSQSYGDISCSCILNTPDFSSKEWVITKEKWLSQNKQLWFLQINKWHKKTKSLMDSSEYERIYAKWLIPSLAVALREGKKAVKSGKYNEAAYLLPFVLQDSHALMLLGQSYYALGAYQDAYSVFIIATQMAIPDSRFWLSKSIEKILC